MSTKCIIWQQRLFIILMGLSFKCGTQKLLFSLDWKWMKTTAFSRSPLYVEKEAWTFLSVPFCTITSTWGWVNNDYILIYGWTTSLSILMDRSMWVCVGGVRGGWWQEGRSQGVRQTGGNKAIISMCLPFSPLSSTAPITASPAHPSVCSRAHSQHHSPQAIEYVTSAMGWGAPGQCAP